MVMAAPCTGRAAAAISLVRFSIEGFASTEATLRVRLLAGVPTLNGLYKIYVAEHLAKKNFGVRSINLGLFPLGYK